MKSWDLELNYCGHFSEGLANVRYEDGSKGYINKIGKLVFKLPEGVLSCGRFFEGLTDVEYTNGRKVYIDKTGKEVIEVPEDVKICQRFSDGLAELFCEEDRVVFIDKTGKVVLEIPEDIKGCSFFSEGLLRAFKGTKGVYIDKTGKTVLELEDVKTCGDFYKGLTEVGYKDGRKVFIDKTGKEVVNVPEDVENFFRRGDGYCDVANRYLLPRVMNYSNNYHDGWTPVSWGRNRQGYIDEEMLSMIDPSDKQNYLSAVGYDPRYIKHVPVEIFEEIKDEILYEVKKNLRYYVENHKEDETLAEDVESKLLDANARFTAKEREVEIEKEKAEPAERLTGEELFKKEKEDWKKLRCKETRNFIDSFTFGTDEGNGKE